ncbi:heme lyase CcmF/NrfE family subunit [Limnochorda pilosa]|uniref:Cytochrome C biogenesis protein n=1 Tax=Limnochorda pilosa TaxID=1555112 RepID=A0A0K2SGA4_LIMPI|nr:cytochrome c-type biogenesis CcmF C-terminal domain-containing protein [Limnochorda pilosa]BAS26072.1 cytochrome C biogenesis protein [Limnochorda pilosa]
MTSLGHWTLIAALATGLYGLVVLVGSARNGDARLLRHGRAALWASVLLVTASSAVLLGALLRADFSFLYVAQHTNLDLSPIYRLSAFWAGQEGSLLLWLWLLLLEGALALGLGRRERADGTGHLDAPAGAVILGVALFFEVLLVTATSPFRSLSPVPPDGAGLNPLLQNAGMLIHPVTLYLGFVGFTIPFAFAMAALLAGDPSPAWVRRTRRWSLLSWLFLTLGIVYGMQWAYVELGWGGFWAWDPVENASLIPWLTATAFLHGARVWEQRGGFKLWTVGLLAATFLLTLFGTYLTRSGVVSSVHAFADTSLGYFFLGFLLLAGAASAGLILYRRGTLGDDREVDHPVSREGAFLLGVLLLTGAAVTVLLGTLSPVLSELITGARVQLDATFFNRVVPPIGLAIVAVMGLAPVLPWRKASGRTARRLLWPVGMAVLTAGLLAALGMRNGPALGTFSLAALVLTVTGLELFRGARTHARGPAGWVAGAARSARLNRSRVGGYLVHVGVVVMVVGMTGAVLFASSSDHVLQAGQMVDVGGYGVHFTGLRERLDSRTQATVYTDLLLIRDKKPAGSLRPEKVFYSYSEQPTTEPAILGGPRGDLYVILNGWEDGGRVAGFTFVQHPLISWMWWGSYLMGLGGLVALWPAAQTQAAWARRPAVHRGAAMAAREASKG